MGEQGGGGSEVMRKTFESAHVRLVWQGLVEGMLFGVNDTNFGVSGL